jgi:hypothetical protein
MTITINLNKFLPTRISAWDADTTDNFNVGGRGPKHTWRYIRICLWRREWKNSMCFKLKRIRLKCTTDIKMKAFKAYKNCLKCHGNSPSCNQVKPSSLPRASRQRESRNVRKIGEGLWTIVSNSFCLGLRLLSALKRKSPTLDLLHKYIEHNCWVVSTPTTCLGGPGSNLSSETLSSAV